jgi:catechol 2,3-dioxygenase-like lactoylglutathione lyase family enzyme
MSLAHVTLATRDVEKTAAFFEQTLGYGRDPHPGNVPYEAAWLNIGRGQQIHLVYVEEFEASPFEREFGRHVAVFYPRPQFEGLKQRLQQHGAELIEPVRPTTFDRFFFRDPNGYLFEVIDQERSGQKET